MKNRKNEIIRAAKKRFIKHGQYKTTLDEIARDLRIGKATLYYYFESKEDLFNETIKHDIGEYIESVTNIFSNENIAVKDRFREFIVLKLALSQKFPLLFNLIRVSLQENSRIEERKLALLLVSKEEEKLSVVFKTIYKEIGIEISRKLLHVFSMQSFGIPVVNEIYLDIDNDFQFNLRDTYLDFYERLLFKRD